jgi:predicted alpha/beta superfamily hydrolase
LDKALKPRTSINKIDPIINNNFFNNDDWFMKVKVKQFLNYSTVGIILCTILACSGKTSSPDNIPGYKTSPDLIIDTIHISSLQRDRIVRILLPKGYPSSSKSYPVIYMMDGQNLFEDSTSYVGEWHVDESMEVLRDQDSLEAIIVGIDNGQDLRMKEYNPYDHERYGAQEGKPFLDNLVKELKPSIDSTYRTLSDKENTVIMGSSMGGLIAFYAIATYPEVFGNAGVLSPSFWISEEVKKLPEQIDNNAKIYMATGEKEGTGMVNSLEEMKTMLQQNGLSDAHLYAEIIPGMEHNEKFWTAEYPKAIKWFFKK